MFGLLFVSVVVAVDFLRIGHIKQGRAPFAAPGELGQDFTVNAPIVVTALGVLDEGNVGFARDVQATIRDRSTNKPVASVTLLKTEGRVNDTQRLALKPVNVVLQRGAYSVVAVGFDAEPLVSTRLEDFVDASDASGLVRITGGTYFSNGSLVTEGNLVHLGATFAFDFLVPPAPKDGFSDCQQVLCQGLPSGLYEIAGKMRFCDNDVAGGGWTRLWDLSESLCEAYGWSSARPVISGNGLDPFGCKAPQLHPPAVVGLSPFPFLEVRGVFRMHAIGLLDAFAYGRDPDGVYVTEESGDTVWLFAIGSDIDNLTICPCDAKFASAPLTRLNMERFPHSSCSFTNASIWEWQEQFVGGCDNRSEFQRTLAAPRSTLSVSITKDHVEGDEDIKLTSAELFVRRTPGFNKAMCRATTAATTTASSSTSSASVTCATVAATDESSTAPVALIAVASTLGVLLLGVTAALICVLSRRRRDAPAPVSQEMQSARSIRTDTARTLSTVGSTSSTSEYVAMQIPIAARAVYQEGRLN